MAARLERLRNSRASAKQNNLTNATVGNEESRVKARGGRRLKRVIAGTCERVSGKWTPVRMNSRALRAQVVSDKPHHLERGVVPLGGVPKVHELFVLFKRAILWVLERSSLAGGFKVDFGVWVMCPELSVMCPCERLDRKGVRARR